MHLLTLSCCEEGRLIFFYFFKGRNRCVEKSVTWPNRTAFLKESGYLSYWLYDLGQVGGSLSHEVIVKAEKNNSKRIIVVATVCCDLCGRHSVKCFTCPGITTLPLYR